jgi:hypothetical protein
LCDERAEGLEIGENSVKIISLGWGVQSFTLAAMAALGKLEPVDAAIHADTTHEMSGTYKFAKKLTPWLEERGVRVVTVGDPEQAKTVTTFKTDIPAFTESIEDGVYGQLRRQCTSRWKIMPIRRWIREELERRELKKTPGLVEQWIGISLDEATRMKPADVKYITHRWPLIEMRMTRHDCKLWLEAHGLEVPPRSSCTFCPFHNQEAWRDMKMNHKKDWQEAIEVDYKIRKARPPYDLFVHPARIPLEEVDLRNQEDRGQLSLWDEECDGVCGV